ncbi:hypothetical protein Bbelb_024840 [Branchiostoma belcheri]|nr:hypothetical protein Bbelb_024840 [Branchiostoma belcheri]
MAAEQRETQAEPKPWRTSVTARIRRVLPSATHADIVDSYKKEVELYERACKLGKRSKKYKEAEVRHRETVGSVSITVYVSTDKILVQGSAYLLWLLEEFPRLKEKVGAVCTSERINNSGQLSVSDSEVSRTPAAPATDGPSSCPTCEQFIVADELCATCNTVPKVLLDCNSNALCTEEEEPSEEKRQLVEDIARLDKVKCELETQIKSLQRKYDELSKAVHDTQSTSLRDQTKTMESQTNQEASDRAERLLYELFQALEVDNNETREVINENRNNSPVSNTRVKHREQTHKAGEKQPPIQNKVNPRPTVLTSQLNKDMPTDVLMLGDSNTKTIKTDVMYPAKRVTKELTYNLTQATDFIQQSTMSDPKVIPFHVGTNDNRDAQDPPAVSESFRKLIQTFPQVPTNAVSVLFYPSQEGSQPTGS